MDALIDVAVLVQAVSAVVGAGGAVVGEISYFRAIGDGRIDAAEAAHLAVIARVLRYAMSGLLIASFVLVVSAYVRASSVPPAVTSGYWMQTLLAVVIIWSTWALSRRRVTFAVGAGTAFSAWWFIALMNLGQVPALSFGALLMYYIVASIIIVAVLYYLRSLYPHGA